MFSKIDNFIIRYLGKINLLVVLELIITTMLFIIALSTGIDKELDKLVGLKGMMIALLSFVIMFEVVRSIMEFVFDGENYKLRYLIDASILFVIREMILDVQKHDFDAIVMYASIIAFLSLYRYIELFAEYKRRKYNLEDGNPIKQSTRG